MYHPPSVKDFRIPVARHRSISYTIDSADSMDEPNTLQSSPSKPNKVRIFFLHGNQQDIKTTYDMRIHFLEEIIQHLPRNLQDSCDIKLITIDYPTFGGSVNDPTLLGSPLLDEQILSLFQSLRANNDEGQEGLNIIWSYSMGTRYASHLIRRAKIDFAYMQAPFYSIPLSSAHIFSGFCSGVQGEGLCALKLRPYENIFLHLGQYDELFPPSVSLDLMRPLARQYIVQPGRNHQWFDTLEAAEVGASIMGKEIGELYLHRDEMSALIAEGAATLQASISSSSSSSVADA